MKSTSPAELSRPVTLRVRCRTRSSRPIRTSSCVRTLVPDRFAACAEYYPEPIRLIIPGKCYRNEDVTTRAEMMFYQVEGLAFGRSVTFSDLKGVLLNFANQMYGEGRQIRFRKAYFPFTEPSVEVDVDCVLCGAQGCRMCKYSGWLEILGAGMVHPTVLRNGGYDPPSSAALRLGWESSDRPS